MFLCVRPNSFVCGSRVNPLTPKMNQELTKEIGNYHAKALDEIGSLYFTEERFDDFYYGKGSTYPDINGGIGILFEQGSSRGHAQKTLNGVITFPFAIRNQFTVALSTLAAAKAMRVKLLNYQRSFYVNAKKEASKNALPLLNALPVFGFSFDLLQAPNYEDLLEILKKHKISLNDVTAVNNWLLVRYKSLLEKCINKEILTEEEVNELTNIFRAYSERLADYTEFHSKQINIR